MLTIAIQAGGASRRMGQDKGLLPFLDQRLIERVIRRVEPLADELIITTNHPESYHYLGLPLFPDLIPGRGALGGLYTALAAATNDVVGVIACDMPFVNPSLLTFEYECLRNSTADLVIPNSGEGLEPFHAVYQRKACLPAIQAALGAEKWRVDSWFDQVISQVITMEQIQKYDPQLVCFKNVNTPDDLKAAEALARQTDVVNNTAYRARKR